MKRFRNPKRIAGLILVVLGIALITAYFCHAPAHEITRAELNSLIENKQIRDGRVLPTPYAGIYHVEGARPAGAQTEHFFVTTHLDDAQIKALLEQSGVKVEMPGEGFRGQWINIVSTLLIGGMVVMLVLY